MSHRRGDQTEAQTAAANATPPGEPFLKGELAGRNVRPPAAAPATETSVRCRGKEVNRSRLTQQRFGAGHGHARIESQEGHREEDRLSGDEEALLEHQEVNDVDALADEPDKNGASAACQAECAKRDILFCFVDSIPPIMLPAHL